MKTSLRHPQPQLLRRLLFWWGTQLRRIRVQMALLLTACALALLLTLSAVQSWVSAQTERQDLIGLAEPLGALLAQSWSPETPWTAAGGAPPAAPGERQFPVVWAAVDARHRIVASSQPGYEGRGAETLWGGGAFARKFWKEGEPTFQETPETLRLWKAFPLVRYPGGSMVLGLGKERAPLGKLFFHGATLAASLTALALLGLVLSVYLNRWLYRPLKVIQAATRQVSQGDYSCEVNIHSPFEFELFSEAFNRMTQEIASKEQQLKTYSETLQSMVVERTRELETSVQQLKQTQTALIRQERMASIGQLAAGVAHEINNPTGYILSNLQTMEEYVDLLKGVLLPSLLLHRTLKEQATAPLVSALVEEVSLALKRDDLEYILKDIPGLLEDSKHGAQRISTIVQGLQSFARMEEEAFRPASLNQAVEEALRIVWNKLKYTCTVHTELGDLPDFPCNQGRLEQVFINLLVNAADAMDGQGTVTLRTWQEGGALKASVTDTGSGIPAEVLPRLFEPFFTTKDVGKGTGLGLSISLGIVQDHGGTIAVTSEPGLGTTFVLTFPLSQETV